MNLRASAALDSAQTNSNLPLRRPSASLGEVFKAQLLLTTAPPRRGIAIGFGLVLLQLISTTTWGLLPGVQIQITDEDTFVNIANVAELGVEPGIAGAFFVFGACLLWGIFWPNRIWKKSSKSGLAYHWALPVDRRTHDLLRVAAGAISLFLVNTALLAATFLALLLSGRLGEVSDVPAVAWVSVLASPQLAYLLFSITPLMQGRRRLFWLWLALGGWLGMFALLSLGSGASAIDEFVVGPFGFVTGTVGAFGFAMNESGSGGLDHPWIPAFLVWFTVALIGVVAAASDQGRRDG